MVFKHKNNTCTMSFPIVLISKLLLADLSPGIYHTPWKSPPTTLAETLHCRFLLQYLIPAGPQQKAEGSGAQTACSTGSESSAGTKHKRPQNISRQMYAIIRPLGLSSSFHRPQNAL